MNKPISVYLSNKIRVISFLLMIMIVVLHSNMLPLSTGLNYYLQLFITNGITRTAVPVFFTISGFLFFLTTDRFDRFFFINKIKNRVKTILIPFLLWSFFGFTLILLLQSVPQIRPFFSGNYIDEMSSKEIFKAILWEPVGTYQLWFLKDLFLIVLISPILYLVIKKARFYPILILVVYWIMGHNLWIIQSESLVFFSTGVYLSIYGRSLVEKKASIQNVILLLFCWITGALFGTFNSTYHIIYYINIILGVITIWTAYDYVKCDMNKKQTEIILPFTFFIFIFHEPLLTILKKSLLFIIGNNSIAIFLIYLLAPTITISLCLLMGNLMKKKLPNIYSLLTGFR